MRKSTFIIIIIIILALIGFGMYWFFYTNTPSTGNTTSSDTNSFLGSIWPFGRGTVSPTTAPQSTNKPTNNNTGTSTNPNTTKVQKMPKLRQLSNTPVSGMSASSTASSTIVRFVDRGTGHIFQANDLNMAINEISNTTLPKIYESYWDKSLTVSVLRYLNDTTNIITSFYSEIRKTATSTSSSTTPFEIKGKYMSPNIDQIAVSPTKDKIFTWNIENGNGVGYISSFDESKKVKIIDTPMTQVNIDWPENSTVTITTKGTAVASGYAYSIDTKTGEMLKLLGNIRGLSIRMSNDGKQVLYSIGGNGILTSLLNVKNRNSSDVIFRTLADKCVWSILRKDEVYCAVPTEIPTNNIYPDDWYKGTVSFVDKIWHLNTTIGEVHLMGDLLALSNQLIDAEQLTLDPKDNFLYFINKRDLTLWVLDLNQ